MRLKLVAADLGQERLGHLAAGAVMDADEKDFAFHNYFQVLVSNICLV
jgi:hypothetical protein